MDSQQLVRKASPFTVILWACILFGIVVRLTFMILTPYGEVVEHNIQGLNDEVAHYNYIDHLKVHRTFAVQKEGAYEPGALERGQFEYHQAPLYYIIDALIPLPAFSPSTLPLYRILSLLFGILTLGMIYRIAVRLGHSKEIALAVVALTSVLLTHSYFSVLVSNDSAIWMIASFILYAGIGAYQKIESGTTARGELVALALLIAIGLLTKSSTVVLLPFVVIIATALAFKKRNIAILFPFVVALAVGCALASPWYIRNLMVYNSLFALDIANGPRIQESFGSLYSIYMTVRIYTRTFWFPMHHTDALLGVRILDGIGGVVILTHLIFAIKYCLIQKKMINWILVVGFAVNLAASIKYTLWHPNMESRFLYIFLPVIVLFMILPYTAIENRRKRNLLISIELIGIVLFQSAYFFFTIPS